MLDKLQNLKVILDTGNLTRAAKKLHVSQPALSISIKKLEKQLGCRLLIRNKSGVKPTKYGKIAYKYSLRLNSSINNMRKQISDQMEIAGKSIKMGMIDNVGIKFVSKIYKNFCGKYPELNLEIQVDNSSRLIREIEKGTIDFAIITKQKKIKSNLIQNDFAEEEMLLVSNIKIAENIKKYSDLSRFSFMAYNKDSTTFKIIDKTFRQKKVEIQYASFSTSPTFIKEMVKQGSGIAVLPRNIVEKELNKNQLKRIELNFKLYRQLSLIYLKNSYLTEVSKNFIRKLEGMY